MDNRREVSNEYLEPNANSTMIEDSDFEKSRHYVTPNTPRSYSANSAMKNQYLVYTHESEDYSVGHISHIPRKPPTPSTYTIPSCVNKSFVKEHGTDEDLFGMIKLKDNDVCYTSGSIEWVGRKRNYPLNSGFKVINESSRQGNESCHKRLRRLDKTFTLGDDNKIKECDCADVLPTVNAIVDHLNALHEAVDLVDLRLNNLEDNIEKN